MTRLYPTYSFWFYEDSLRIEVQFLGPKSWEHSGADHSYHHRIRRSWANSLIGSYEDSWRCIPSHPYVNFLEQQGFPYDEYLIRFTDSTTVTIICRYVG